MAIMLARHIRSLGHEPIVYQLPSFHAVPEGLATASTIEALLKTSDLCILGGGGHLCEISGVDKLDEELSELVNHAALASESFEVPLRCRAIGGCQGEGDTLRMSGDSQGNSFVPSNPPKPLR